MRLLGRADARTLLLFLEVGLARRHALHGERQPPRRREGLGALIDEAGIDQPVGDELLQVLRRARLHAGGNFFGEQFEQKVGHGSGFDIRGARDGGAAVGKLRERGAMKICRRDIRSAERIGQRTGRRRIR